MGVARITNQYCPTCHQALRSNELSPLQRQIMVFLADGRSNGFICGQLNISLSTLKRQRHAAYGKLGLPMFDKKVNLRVQAALAWLKKEERLAPPTQEEQIA